MLTTFLAATSWAQKIYWSDGDGGSNTIDPAGWNDIETALTNAESNPSTIGEVKLSGDFQRAKGDATVGSLWISNGNIRVSGGWSADFASQSGRSILDANGENTANNKQRAMVVAGTNVALTDLQITGGYLNQYVLGVSFPGAGLLVAANHVSLTNLVVTNNLGMDGYCDPGGGIAVIGAADVIISRCIVANNYGALNAGGIYIAGNSGRYGNPVLVEYCDIRNNWTGGTGGGVYVGESGSGVYTRALVSVCRITNNRAANGAGIYAGSFDNTAHQQVFFGCLIQGNRNVAAGSYGTGASKGNRTRSHMVNCTVVDNINTNDSTKSGLYVGTGSWGNDAYLRFVNSIVSDNNGCYVYAMNTNYGGAGGHMELQRTTINESSYARQHNGDVLLTTNSFVGALSFSPVPGYHSISDAGATTQLIEENLEDNPGFLGGGGFPYSLSGTSTSLDNAWTRSGGAYTYVDVNANGSYNALYDIIVDGTPPAGTHYFYPFDLTLLDSIMAGTDMATLAPNRFRVGGLDRGAYERAFPLGTIFRFN